MFRVGLGSGRSPQIYLEHLVVPRLHWMLDLDILDATAFARNTIQFSIVGERIYGLLCDFYSTYNEKSNLCLFLLEEYFFQMISYVYNLGCESKTRIDHVACSQYVLESFQHFRTAAPNSISAAQSIFYACYKTLLNDQEVIEFSDIKALLMDNTFHNFRLEWYQRENDGALYRSK
jgi:hypothetical protein